MKRDSLVAIAAARSPCPRASPKFWPSHSMPTNSPSVAVLNQPTAELRAAPLPAPVSLVAVHLYFITSDGQEPWQRWEVWQRRNAFRTPPQAHQKAYGHVHLNLMAPHQGVGGGPSYPLQRWNGPEAKRLIETLRTGSATYVSRDRYLLWPGPNSNTFVSRILADAGIEASLPATAIGKDWDGAFKLQTSASPPAFNFYTPLLGANLTVAESLELQLLGFSVGVHLKRREMKLPIGKGLWKLLP